MNPAVETPSAERVKAACEKYDREHKLIEQSLEELVRQYPQNSDPRHVLLKVVAVNALEHTAMADGGASLQAEAATKLDLALQSVLAGARAVVA